MEENIKEHEVSEVTSPTGKKWLLATGKPVSPKHTNWKITNTNLGDFVMGEDLWEEMKKNPELKRRKVNKNYRFRKTLFLTLVETSSCLICLDRGHGTILHWPFYSKSFKINPSTSAYSHKLAIRACFCLPVHPINDNLLGMNTVQADARRMLRELQLIPQKPTLLWPVPLQKAPAFISAKQSCSVIQNL